MRKKLVLYLLVFILLFALVVATGCSKNEPSKDVKNQAENQAGNQGEEQVDNQTDEQKVYEVRFNHTTPEVTKTNQVILAWAKKIEERSNGRIKFTHYWSNSLIPDPTEIPRGISSGVADMSWMAITNIPGNMTLELFLLPGLGWPSLEAGTEIYGQMLEEFEVLQEEYTSLGMKLYTHFRGGPANLYTTEKPVKTPDDLKGMRFIASGFYSDIVAQLGATPMTLSPGDWYTATERGMVDGKIAALGVINAFNLTPLMKNFVIMGDSGLVMELYTLVMNPDFYNNLPPDLQALFDEEEPALREALVQDQKDTNAYVLKTAEELGHSITYLTADEVQVWVDKCAPLHEEVIKRHEAKGKPAREVYNRMLELISSYE